MPFSQKVFGRRVNKKYLVRDLYSSENQVTAVK